MSWRSWPAYLRPHPSSETPVFLRLFIAVVSGAALSLSYTGLYLSLYSWVCIGVLMVVLFGASQRAAFFCGFLHGLAFVLTSVPWIAEVLAVHGGLSKAGGWGLLLLIAVAWGILTGSFAWIVNRLSRCSVTHACIGAPFVWVTFEFIRAHLPEISFPWNLLGYPASGNLALVQVTTVTGIYGLSFLVAAFNGLLAWCDAAASPTLKKRLLVIAAATALILIAMFAGPKLVPGTSPRHYARAVQPNFPEVAEYEANWYQAHQEDLDELKEFSLTPTARKPDLLIWPEAPAPFSYQVPEFSRLATEIASKFENPFLAGVVEWKPPKQAGVTQHASLEPYNSAIEISPQGQRVFSYDKIHLVPFGEYEPFPLIHRVVSSVSAEVGGFRKGSAYSVGTFPNGYKFGVYICYEAIYPGEVRHFAANGANLLINISNDGWFGRSAAAEQHLRMALVRAVENRRWVLRVTNSGLTASVDPYGRVNVPILRDVRGAADLPYDFRSDKTIYTRFGDWFAWVCVVVTVWMLVGTFLRKRSNEVTK